MGHADTLAGAIRSQIPPHMTIGNPYSALGNIGLDGDMTLEELAEALALWQRFKKVDRRSVSEVVWPDMPSRSYPEDLHSYLVGEA